MRARASALLHPGIWSWWAFALAAATLGFLPFNFPKARIFLGDVGSGALGFVLAALLIWTLAGTSVDPCLAVGAAALRRSWSTRR